MIDKINNQTPKYLILNSFASNPTKRNDYLSYRYHRTHKTERREEIQALAGSVIGTGIALMAFAKKQKTNPLKIHYGLMELIGVSAGAIIGGVAGGIIKADPFDKKRKVNEGIFQFANASIPPAIVLALNTVTEKSKMLNSKLGRIATTVVGLVGGMFAAAEVSNFIADPGDFEKDRKLTVKDSLANIDDALGVLAMSDFPALQKIAGPLLPVIYVLCGFRAGESN